MIKQLKDTKFLWNILVTYGFDPRFHSLSEQPNYTPAILKAHKQVLWSCLMSYQEKVNIASHLSE